MPPGIPFGRAPYLDRLRSSNEAGPIFSSGVSSSHVSRGKFRCTCNSRYCRNCDGEDRRSLAQHRNRTSDGPSRPNGNNRGSSQQASVAMTAIARTPETSKERRPRSRELQVYACELPFLALWRLIDTSRPRSRRKHRCDRCCPSHPRYIKLMKLTIGL
jgi:hypothetical protein